MGDYFGFDSDTFAMAEKVADMLALVGATSLEVDGETLVHAARLETPTSPLVGHGDTVSPGDVVELWWHGDGKSLETPVAIVNYYDLATKNLSLVTQYPDGYSVTLMALSGPWGRRSFRLRESAPEVFLPHTNASLDEDHVVTALDELFARHGQPRPASPLDLPVVAMGADRSHAALQGRTQTACGRVLPTPASGPLFDAATPGACVRCQKKMVALSPPGSFQARSSRRALLVEVYAHRF